MPSFVQIMASNPGGFGQCGRALEANATRLDVALHDFSGAVKAAEEGWRGAAKDAQSAAAARLGDTLDMVSHAAVRAGAAATRGGMQLAPMVTELRTLCQNAMALGFLVLPSGTVVPGPSQYAEAAAAGPGAGAVLEAYQVAAQAQTQAVVGLVGGITAQDTATAGEIQALLTDLSAGQASSRTPKTDQTRAAPAPVDRNGQQIPDWIWSQIQNGNAFDERREPYYTARGGANEVHVPGGRLDSYVPDREIVSRKYTQLASVQQSTAEEYLRELERKYPPGTQILSTPSNESQLPGIGGYDLSGEMILEVPPQAAPVPQGVLDAAAARDITIRDTLGTVYR